MSFIPNAIRRVFIGPPGAGKGTQKARLSVERGIPRISSGEILREFALSGTLLGNQVKDVISRGELLSDDLIVAVIRERLRWHDVMGGVVLDGFPRTLGQAMALDSILTGRALVVVVLSVSEQVVTKRLSLRRICAACGINATDGSDRCAQCGEPVTRRSDDTCPICAEICAKLWTWIFMKRPALWAALPVAVGP